MNPPLTHGRETGKGTGEDYFLDACELRVAIERNIADYRFAHKEHGRIKYVFDTNVLLFFLNPLGETRHIDIFGDRTAKHSNGTAVCTAEFLFSRELAGQWGEPAYVAPGHAEELANTTRKAIASAGDSELAVTNHNQRAVNRLLREIEQDLARVRLQRFERDRVQEIVGRISRLTELLSRTGGLEAQLLVRVFEHDLIRPLDLDPDATDEVLAICFNPDEKDVWHWYRPILAKRKAREYRVDHRQRVKSWYDAQTIVQLIKLNELAARSLRLTKYVFVTADWSLYLAYSEWYAEHPLRQAPRFLLRRINQYIPILNPTEIPNGLNDDPTIFEARDTLDSLLSNIRASSPDYPYSLPALLDNQLRHLSGPASIQGSRPSEQDWARAFAERVFSLSDEGAQLATLRQFWVEASDNALALSVNMLERRFNDLKPLADSMANANNLVDSVRSYINSLMERLEAEHIALSLQANLLGRRGERGATVGSTGLLLLYEPFDATGKRGGSLPDYIRYLAHAGSREELKDVTDLIRQRPQDPKVLVLAGCVAFQNGVWDAADFYIERASEKLEILQHKENLGRRRYEELKRQHSELEYLQAVTIRHAIEEEVDTRFWFRVEQAERLLQSSLAYFERSGNKIRTVRGYGEWGSLHILVAMFLRLENMAAASQPGKDLTYSTAEGRASEAVQCFHRGRDIRLNDKKDLFDPGIDLLLGGLAAGIAVYDVIFARRTVTVSSEDLQWVTPLVVDAVATSDTPPPLYVVAAKILEAFTPGLGGDPRQLLTDASRLIREFLESADTDPSPWDRRLLPIVAQRLESTADIPNTPGIDF